MRATSATGSNRGFTLIELTAVLMLVAIGFAALSYGLTAQLENQRVKAAARELVAALRQTRAQAILKGESQALELDLRERSYRVPGREPVSLPEGMELRMLTARSEQIDRERGRIRFYRDGSSTGGNIGLIKGQREWRIEVAWLTGEVVLRERER
ncbi:MAG: general secretion pathway protein GspH [Lysobacterales bacterium]|jgi:general secretion pathway protein H|nr:MAG: general secretion pathway protein GspH [Xanthomonadales bacterium]